MLSMWSLLWDNSGTPGRGSDSMSGLLTTRRTASPNIFNGYGTVAL